jgi:HK97 family phage major capsid protein
MNQKLVEYRERMGRAINRLDELQKLDTRSNEQESEIDSLLAEVNDLGPKMVREQQIEDTAKRTSEFASSAGRPSQRGIETPNARTPQQPMIDRRSIGKRFVEAEKVINYRKGDRGGYTSFDAESFYHGPQIQHNSDTSPDELRTLIYGGALAADMVRPQLVPGFFRGDDLQASVRDVLINGQTTSDAILFMRELLFTNAAAAVAEASATGDTSGTKPESALTFEQATAPVVTIAHWIPITRQALDDTAQLETYVNQRLIDGLKLAESDSILNGTGTPDLTGILQTGSVQALNEAYFGGAPVLDAGGLNENFNRILRAKTLIRTVGRARASFAVVNPADMEVFLSSTNTQGNYYGAGPFGGGSAVGQMWGLRVVEDENITAGTALVGDGRMAAVWDRMQAQIFVGWIDKQFIRNMLTILAEERLALTVFRPQAFAVVTLAP